MRCTPTPHGVHAPHLSPRTRKHATMTVNPTASAAPAGWYRDPLGLPQLRWWNGIGWTNHIQEERAELHAYGQSA